MYYKIYNEDCIKHMQLMEAESVDLIVTDPPYIIEYKTNYRKDKNHKFCTQIANDNNKDLIIDYIKLCYRILKNDSAMYMFCSSKTIDFFKQELEKYFTIKNIIVWVKNNWAAGDLECQFGQQYEFLILVNKGQCKFNGKRLTDVWHFDRVAGDKLIHQNQKPLPLIKQCIEKHSKVGDVVFDGFMGSGTTGVACKYLKRSFIGCEIDDYYFRIANSRINDVIFKEDNETNLFDYLCE